MQSPVFIILAAVPALFVLAVIRSILRAVLSSLYLSTFIDISRIPQPALSPLRTYTTGHNWPRLALASPSPQTAVYLNELRARHGPIFCLRSLLGEPVIFVTSADAIRCLSQRHPQRYVKPEATRRALESLVGRDGILLAEGERHPPLRRAVAAGLHRDALLSVEHVFFRAARRFAASVVAPNYHGDVLHATRTGTFNVVFQAAFGDGAVPDPTLDKLREAYLTCFFEPPSSALRRVVMQTIFDFASSDFLGYKVDLKTYIRKTIFDLCEDITTPDKKSLPPADEHTGRNLLSLMVDEQTQRLIPQKDMVDTILSFLTAGQVTTSLSICWTLQLLASHPEWQHKLHGEVTAGWCEQDGLEELDRLPLLHRVVKESMRLYPPVFYIAREVVEEDEVDGYRLPPGAVIRIPVLAIQRNEEIWGEDAAKFDPDRFLKAHVQQQSRFFWCAFLFGPRGCVGQRFAILEIKAFVAMVLRKCVIENADGGRGMPSIAGPFATPRGMALKFHEREKTEDSLDS